MLLLLSIWIIISSLNPDFCNSHAGIAAVIYGDDKGAVGKLLSIDGIEGVIKLENRPEREEITMKQLKYLCKLADN
jgi:hypothetical protein